MKVWQNGHWTGKFCMVLSSSDVLAYFIKLHFSQGHPGLKGVWRFLKFTVKKTTPVLTGLNDMNSNSFYHVKLNGGFSIFGDIASLFASLVCDKEGRYIVLVCAPILLQKCHIYISPVHELKQFYLFIVDCFFFFYIFPIIYTCKYITMIENVL